MFLIAAAQLLPEPVRPRPRAEARATASVRIERPGIADRRAWENSSSRRVLVIRDERGEPVLVRVIEYE